MWLSIFVTWVCGQNYEPEFKKNTYAEVAALVLNSAGMFISGTQMYGSGRGFVNELSTSVNSNVLTEVNAGGREAAARQSGIDKTSYGKSSKNYKNSLDYLKDIENINGKYYADKKIIDEIGQIEARGEDFSRLNKSIMSSRASTEGGTSIVYRYSDEYGTKYMIHEVTIADGYIIHRDFDAVRILSGQIINKGH